MTAAERSAALLRRRSIELARPLAQTQHTPTSDVLVVAVAGRRLGLDARRVTQVLPGRGLCRLPHGCGALIALVPAHGGSVPVADLGLLLGSDTQGSRPFVVLLEGDAPPVGVLVDAVHEVRPVADRDVQPAPGARDDSSLEAGVTVDGLVILDLDRILADSRLHPRSSTKAPQPPAPSGEPCLG